jgi:hypothetical protein
MGILPTGRYKVVVVWNIYQMVKRRTHRGRVDFCFGIIFSDIKSSSSSSTCLIFMLSSFYKIRQIYLQTNTFIKFTGNRQQIPRIDHLVTSQKEIFTPPTIWKGSFVRQGNSWDSWDGVFHWTSLIH